MRSAETNAKRTIVDDVDAAYRRRARAGGRGAMAFALLLGMAVPAVQAAPEGSAPATGAQPRSGRSREDMRETITLLMMVRMKNELALSQQQYEQVLPRVEERERSRRSNFRERRHRLDQLRTLLGREGVKDAELTEAVEGLLALDETDRRQDESFVSDMRRILSPRQQAQLLLFRQRFRQWIEGRMRDAQELRRRHGRRGFAGREGGATPDGNDTGDGASGPEAPDRP